MNDTVLLPPVLFAQSENDDPFDDEEDSDWTTPAADSRRPAYVRTALLAFLAAMAAVAGRVVASATRELGSGTASTPSGGGTVAADAAANAAVTATAEYAHEAERVIAEHAPKVALAISKWVQDATGLKTPISTAKVEADLEAKVQSYLAGNVVSLTNAARVAAVNWMVVPGSTELELRAALSKILDGAAWQAKRIVATESQQAYKGMFRDAATRSGAAKIERICQPTACDMCVGLCGVHYADGPDLYNDHPQCQCVYAVAEDDASVDFGILPAFLPVFYAPAAVLA